MTTHAFFDPFGAFATEDTAPSRARSPRRTLSYRDLLGDAWSALPAATRARFAHHEALYAGSMTLRATAAGRWVARLCTLVGSPLPPPWHAPLAATVRVEPDGATGGSRWTRCYDFPRKRVSVASVKAIDADGALVERLSCGLRMRLTLAVRDAALCFDSAGYYVECEGLAWGGRRYGAWRLELPSWFLPGRTCVSHDDLGDGRFRFTMTIRHALLGELFHHEGVFHAVE
ncbi:MAG TPA: DUF4166 domain-containing protein [Gammaproteobacteria bacterium]